MSRGPNKNPGNSVQRRKRLLKAFMLAHGRCEICKCDTGIIRDSIENGYSLSRSQFHLEHPTQPTIGVATVRIKRGKIYLLCCSCNKFVEDKQLQLPS